MLLRCAAAVALWAAALAGAGGRALAAESEPLLAAADLVQPSLLAGPGFRVAPKASLRGLQARFVLHTEWGEVEADSVEMLALRVAEMPALGALHARDLSEVLAAAGLDELGSPLRAVQALGSEPLQRLVRLPGGILRYFTTRLRGWGDRARRVGHRIDQALSHEGSPYGGLRPEAPSSDASGADAEAPWWDAPVDEIGRLLRSESGHGRARREIARAFGVDPSTSHPLIRQRLDQLAWAVSGQRIALDRALGLAAPGLAQVIGELERAADLTGLPNDESLRRRNHERLGHWTADAELAYALAWRGGYPPQLFAELLDELDRLAPRRGAEAVLEVARMARGEAEARFVIQALRLLQAPRAERSGHGELVAVGALLGWRDDNGEFYLSLPVDHLSWIPEVADWFDHARVSGHARRSVLLSAGLTPRAERAITRRGWSVLRHLDHPGAPPYRRPSDPG